jgi:peroxin-2
VPLINFTKLRNKMTRFVSSVSSFDVEKKVEREQPDSVCMICYKESGGVGDCRVHNAYETSCGHVYCYYCIK